MSEKLPRQRITEIMSAYWVSQAVYVAARLGIADLLTDGPQTAE
nr:methyltransferase [Planctomycetales bacterium]